ncbi:hypothetical protein M1E25_20940 [Streptomyces sp. MTZ3.1]|uniref:Uncharacterized protein n=1 Tax=Streptomyces meridianus TaxID=2938945 RepID=A0ABT0XDI9_9ACTN|nr:hypothetical protein [Streptomyces meridianus]MCM2579782.1 hypothetical protein [Streptomyces meridianus]
MADAEFTATGVRIGRRLRSVTRAGQVLVRNGRLELLTSYGTEIDSAPVESVRAVRYPFGVRDRALAAVNGTWYLLTLGEQVNGGTPPASSNTRRFTDALRTAGGGTAAVRAARKLRGPLPGATLDGQN